MSGMTRKDKAIRRARRLALSTVGKTAVELDIAAEVAERDLMLAISKGSRVNVELHLTIDVPKDVKSVDEIDAWMRERYGINNVSFAEAGGRLCERWHGK